jgi:hypothetical protein
LHWHLSITREGSSETWEGYDMDKFQLIASYCQNLPAKARVAVTIGRSTDFGALKISCTVSIDCPQTDDWVHQAQQLVAAAAADFVNAVSATLDPGLQPLPKLPVPW